MAQREFEHGEKKKKTKSKRSSSTSLDFKADENQREVKGFVMVRITTKVEIKANSQPRLH